MDLTAENLKFPPDYEDARPQTEEPTPFIDSHCPHCPACSERWEIDEGAQTAVSIAMHCVQPWVIITCPKCNASFMVTGSGKSSSPGEGEEVMFVMSVSQYWIARLRA